MSRTTSATEILITLTASPSSWRPRAGAIRGTFPANAKRYFTLQTVFIFRLTANAGEDACGRRGRRPSETQAATLQLSVLINQSVKIRLIC